MKPLLFALVFLSLSSSAADQTSKKLHILPDSPGWAYLGKVPKTFANPADRAIQPALTLGERSLAWLTYMNSFRPEGNKLQLTKPGDLNGIPIEKPQSYNVEIIETEHAEIEAQIPAELKTVLFSTDKNYPKDLPVAEVVYVHWARKIDRNYQTAARWKIMAPWLGYLEQRREEDIRGYYFLTKKTDNVENFLRSYATLPNDQKAQVQEWLGQMCMNGEGLDADCDQMVAASLKSGKAYEFYLKYLPRSQAIWDSNFSLHNPRREIVWNQTEPLKMIVPFQDPRDFSILNFLKLNIENEWKWDAWGLVLDFRKSAAIHVEFQAGATPHVNGLGGNTIVMDKNAPLTEWDVQWTIRHEFGHVLGFTDCYMEFYDPKVEAIVTYQLDIQNLMCARSGRMQKIHYETLKSVYMK